MRFIGHVIRAGFVAIAVAVSLSAVHAADADARLAAAWPELASDLPADASVRFGVLPSGMRYAIMPNETPRGQVALRLRVAAGSLHERDDQRGLAHFLEHLAFRGSSQVPDGEVQRSLERLGLRMGGDTNASTSQTQTIIRFDLPNNDEQSVTTGLMLLREIAGELTLSPDAMEKERGVVLSEERGGDTPNMRVRLAQSAFLLKGQLAPDRFPIGEVEVIRNAPASLAADFYHAYYRPERATLVAVGDFDPAEMESKIAGRFSDWRGTGEAGAEPDLGSPPPRGAEAAVFAEEGAPPIVTVSWVTPYDASPNTRAKVRRDLIEAIAFAIVNQRFQRAAAEADPPFLSAGISRNNTAHSARITTLGATYDSGQWQRALQTAEQLRLQVLAEGVRQDEVEREAGAYLTRLETRVTRAATRTSTGLIGDILDAVDDGDVFMSPADELALARDALSGLTAEEASAALRQAFAGGGPLVFLSTSDSIEDGESVLMASYMESRALPLANEAAPQLDFWPYTAFGTPGAVSERRFVDDLDVTLVRFANGVQLTVKPTSFRADQIMVEARIGGGLLALPKNRPETAWAALGGGFITGGLEAMDYVEMRRLLATHIYSTGFGTAEDAFVLSGTTRRADLDTQLQVLAAYVAAPGWRPEAFQRAQNGWAAEIARARVSPGAVFGQELPALLHSGDLRWASPATPEELESAKLEDAMAVIGGALARAPIELIVVGDVDVEQAVAAAAATFGALPAREEEAMPAPEQSDVRFPEAMADPIVLRHSGRADQGLAFVAWPTADFFADMQMATNLTLLGDIVRLRLAEEVRAENGATYSPQAGARASVTFSGYGYIYALTEIPPEKMTFFFDTVAAIVADLRQNGPSADELERVLAPAADTLERTAATNGYWLGLRGAYRDERRLEMLRTAQSRLAAVTAEGLRAAAAKYLNDAAAWKLVVEPES